MSARARAGSPPQRRPIGAGGALALAFVASFVFAVALAWARFVEIWRSGGFFDTDDAMRAVQVRDLLAGQGWFDLTAHRLNPPHGESMHWSRVVDIPLAAGDLFFSLFMTPDLAERVTRLLFPLSLLAALLFVSGWIGALLSGAAARLLAMWLVALSGLTFTQFAPGRIDHHAPQIVTLCAAFGLLLEGLDPRRASRLAAAAGLIALSLSIGLENLPFFIPVAAAVPLLFIADGVAARRQLASFALGLLVALPALYALTRRPADYFGAACDALSFVHLAAFAAGAVSLLVLAVLSPRLTRVRGRLAAAGVAATAPLACVLLLGPQCLGDPLAGLDPLIRQVWLAHVTEAAPLLSQAAATPQLAVVVAAPVMLGLLSALAHAWLTRGLTRRRWILTAVTIGFGVAAGFAQVRVFTSVTPLALVALAAGIAAPVSSLGAMPALRAALAAAIAMVVSPVGLALAVSRESKTPAGGGEASCLTREALAPLASLPPARVLATFNLGPYILAYTPHSVYAAPYHRNNQGNRVAADVFLAPPGQAEAIARRAGVELIAWCDHADTPPPLATAAPDGLGAMLSRGEAPLWLERRSAEGAPLLVFALRPVE